MIYTTSKMAAPGNFQLLFFLFFVIFSCEISAIDDKYDPTFVDRNTDRVDDSELDQYRDNILYPINHTANELLHINEDTLTITKALSFRLPYFGFAFNYTIVNMNGFVFFSDFMRRKDRPLKFPNPMWPNENDPSFIAPFMADNGIGIFSQPNPSRKDKTPSDRLEPGVYFRQEDLTKIKEGETQDREKVILKKRLQADFSDGMNGAETFEAQYVMIVSWIGMTMRNSKDLKRINNFQMVLVTDQKNTYVMFNYERLNWRTHDDQTLGQTGYAAFVGFNAGNGTMAHEFKPYSQSDVILSLQSGGYGNRKKGRYYFNIDEEIFLGSCIDTSLNPDMQAQVRVTANPGNGNMLGGTLVNVTGPCFSENADIKCSFYDKVVPGIFVSENKAMCVQPFLSFYGYSEISVSVGGGSFTFLDDYYIEPPDLATNIIIVEGDDDKQEKPKTLTLLWDKSFLSSRSGVRLTASLWGYREVEKSVPDLIYINTLAEEGSINNDDEKFIVDTAAFEGRNDHGKLDLNFGFIMLNISEPTAMSSKLKKTPYIWSKPTPLAWYFWPQWEEEADGDDYKTEKCTEWEESETEKNQFAFELPECPCTLQQALADKGQFVPDQDCNIIDRKCDIFNQGARHCVRSGQASMQGAGQQCCYDNQDELMHTNDFFHGARPTRAYPYGLYPYNKKEFVPTLSTWHYDIMPFMFCCKWDKKQDMAENCQKFKARRTTQDCVGYRSPAIASVFGDPHFVTFDGVSYTFNGKGEYTLMTINNNWASMNFQGRFDQMTKDSLKTYNSEKFKATILTAVAAKTNFSESVEIHIRPPAARWRYHLSVYVGERYVFFNQDSLKMQSYKGVTVYVPEAINNQSQVNVMFHNGAGMEVTEVNGFMSVRFFVPFVFMNGTKGLLGTFSKDKLDEFKLPDDSLTSVTSGSNTRDIHEYFGKHWQLSTANEDGKGSSLFGVGKVSSDITEFIPEFKLPPDLKIQENSSISAKDIENVCKRSIPCQYDYIVTGNPDLAVSTKYSQDLVINLQSDSQEPVVRCSSLKTPLNGHKTTIKYTVGTNVRFICDDGYRLIGHESRQCREDGLWSWGEIAECIPSTQYNLQVSGIVFGVMIPILILIIIVIVCIVGRRRRNKEKEPQRWNERDAYGGNEENGPLKMKN